MTVLHEILAVERHATEQANLILEESVKKFGKTEYFSGHTSVLKMLVDSPENDAIARAAFEERPLITTVFETVQYALSSWANAEDVIFRKNVTNTVAKADFIVRGVTIATDVPVDELMGLENRLKKLREVMARIPTLDNSKKWEKDENAAMRGVWVTPEAVVTAKTEKVTKPVVLYEATEHHPAQVKEVSTDTTVGTYERSYTSGAATSRQKANVLALLDEMMAEVKKARMRANQVQVVEVNIGHALTKMLLDELAS